MKFQVSTLTWNSSKNGHFSIMKNFWDLKKVFTNLEPEGQGRGIIMGVTRLLLLKGHFTTYRPIFYTFLHTTVLILVQCYIFSFSNVEFSILMSNTIKILFIDCTVSSAYANSTTANSSTVKCASIKQIWHNLTFSKNQKSITQGWGVDGLWKVFGSQIIIISIDNSLLCFCIWKWHTKKE